MDILIFLLFLVLGVIITHVFYRIIVLPKMQHRYESLHRQSATLEDEDEDLGEDANVKRLQRVKRNKPVREIAQYKEPISELAKNALDEMEELVNVSIQTYERTEKLKRTVRAIRESQRV